MGKQLSKVKTLLGRLVKVVMAALIVPLAIGLLLGVLEQLDVTSLSGSTFRHWVSVGFVTYVIVHLLLYRPVGLFRVSHRMFSAIAVWLFGGQVASVEQAASGKGKSGRSGKGEGSAPASTLVAFSPYVIPLYMALACLAGWALGRWGNRAYVDAPVSVLIGLTMAFHWLMTADDLQQQRAQWHVETYLLAIGLVFVLTLFIASLCLPLAVPEFSFGGALAAGWSRTHAIYTTAIQQLFF